jgi:hypothetical protein
LEPAGAYRYREARPYFAGADSELNIVLGGQSASFDAVSIAAYRKCRARQVVLEMRFAGRGCTHRAAHSCLGETSRYVGVAGFAAGLSREG